MLTLALALGLVSQTPIPVSAVCYTQSDSVRELFAVTNVFAWNLDPTTINPQLPPDQTMSSEGGMRFITYGAEAKYHAVLNQLDPGEWDTDDCRAFDTPEKAAAYRKHFAELVAKAKYEARDISFNP